MTAAAKPADPAGSFLADATPAQIRAALAPEDARSFDQHWRTLMYRATERLDLTEVQEALQSWRYVAWATSVHGADVYRRTVAVAEERLRTGERGPNAVPWHQIRAELDLSD